MVEGGAVGLVVVGLLGLWVCCDGGLRLIIGGLWWWVCTLQWVSEFSFFILRCSKHCKIFFRLFSKMQSNIGKTIIFPEIIYIYKYFTVKNVLRRNKQSLRSKAMHVGLFSMRSWDRVEGRQS